MPSMASMTAWARSSALSPASRRQPSETATLSCSPAWPEWSASALSMGSGAYLSAKSEARNLRRRVCPRTRRGGVRRSGSAPDPVAQLPGPRTAGGGSRSALSSNLARRQGDLHPHTGAGTPEHHRRPACASPGAQLSPARCPPPSAKHPHHPLLFRLSGFPAVIWAAVHLAHRPTFAVRSVQVLITIAPGVERPGETLVGAIEASSPTPSASPSPHLISTQRPSFCTAKLDVSF